jgi:hypothetical protein
MRGNTHTHEKSLSGTLGEPQLFFSSFLLRSNLVKKKMLIVRRRRKNSFVAIMCRLLKHNEKKERHTAPMQQLFPLLFCGLGARQTISIKSGNRPAAVAAAAAIIIITGFGARPTDARRCCKCVCRRSPVLFYLFFRDGKCTARVI